MARDCGASGASTEGRLIEAAELAGVQLAHIAAQLFDGFEPDQQMLPTARS